MVPEPLPGLALTTATSCRSCGGAHLVPVLSLGKMPLANSLVEASRLDAPEDLYPLDLVFCPGCSLVQITETLPPERLFREYVYFSSYSDTALKNAAEIAERLVSERHLDSRSFVVEVASNDGYLLQNYRRHGVPVLGIEPAQNVARKAEQRAVPTLVEFFSLPLAERLRSEGREADVLHANNVLAHVADLNGFVAGLRALLKKSGVVVIEVPYVQDLVTRLEFDTIYHEHLCYFSLTALNRLLGRHGLHLTNVEHLAIHGGTLRVFAARDDSAEPTSPLVHGLLAGEQSAGIDRQAFYSLFAGQVESLRTELASLLGTLKDKGHRLAAYGASAKGTTLLNYIQVGRETLDFVVDRSPVKQGLYTPGTHLPIWAPERLLEAMPEYVLLLSWNFADEILEQQAEYRRRGGRFIVPVPKPRIV